MSDPSNIPAGNHTGGGHHAGDNTIACLFGTRDAAERAASDLVDAGIARANIEVLDNAEQRPGTAASTTAPIASPGGLTSAPEDRLERGSESGGGFWDSIKRLFSGDDDQEYATYYEGVRQGQTLLTVRAMDDAEAGRAAAILERHDPIDMDAQESQWRETGWTGASAGGMSQASASGAGTPVPGIAQPSAGRPMTTSASTTTASTPMTKPQPPMTGQREPAMAGRGEERIPVVEEQVAIGKRATQLGRVRVHSRVVETPVQEDVRLREERVSINRTKVDRPVSGEDAFRERAVEMTAKGEEAVVGKSARVTEEVVVRKEAGERVEQVRDTVRRTEVSVDDDRTGLQGGAGAGSANTSNPTAIGSGVGTGVGQGQGPRAPGKEPGTGPGGQTGGPNRGTTR